MQYRYAKLKSTGRIIATQSGGDPDTDDLDVFASGLDRPVDQLEVGYESEEVISGWWEAQNEADRTYVDKRLAEYPSINDVTVALAEKAEGNSTMWNEITLKRQAVKTKHPKE